MKIGTQLIHGRQLLKTQAVKKRMMGKLDSLKFLNNPQISQKQILIKLFLAEV